MAVRFILQNPVPERVGWGYFGEIFDEENAPVPASAFSVLQVSKIYVEDAALTEIVAVPASILNAGRGTLDAAGNLTIIWLPGDSVIVNATSEISITGTRRRVKGERHVALLEGLYATGREFAREIAWDVVNLAKR